MTNKFFLIRQNQWGSSTYSYFSEDGRGKWKNTQSIDDYTQADFIIYVNRPNFKIIFPPEKTLCFTGEPDEWFFSKHVWSDMPEGVHIYPRPINHWHSFITYQEFKEMQFPEKTKNLSWVTTSQGDKEIPNIQTTEGQRLRMKFLKIFLQKHPNKLYLYGRDLNKYYPMQDFRFCGGVLTDLWDGLEKYRYSLAFETSLQDGYFCKLYDPILAGCMPIYYGGNLDGFLPKNCVIRVDLRKDLDSISDEVVEIIESDIREQNLDELEAAKELLLDKWNVFEIFSQEISKII